MRKLPHFLDRGDHSCAFYKDEAEKLRIIAPFFRAGLILHEKCVYIASWGEFKTMREGVQKVKGTNYYFEDHEILHVDSSFYLSAFEARDVQRLCGAWREMIESFLAEGYEGVRGVGALNVDYTPELQDFLLEYEKAITPLFRDYPVSGICLYPDRSARTSFGRKIKTQAVHPVCVDPLAV